MNLEKQFNEEIKAFLEETAFPAESIAEHFEAHKRFALSFETPKSLGITNKSFRELLTEDPRERYALHEMITILQAMENRTRYEHDCATRMEYIPLTQTSPSYIQFLEDLESMTKVLNGISGPKRDSLCRKYEAMDRIQHGTPIAKTRTLITGKA